jgi:hypothetical protein
LNADEYLVKIVHTHRPLSRYIASRLIHSLTQVSNTDLSIAIEAYKFLTVKMSKNAGKCRKMSQNAKNVEKCRKMSQNAENFEFI